MTEPNTNQHMTLDEILTQLSEIGRNGEGADRFRAIKLISTMNSAQAALPDPISDSDLVQRLARLMRAAGKRRTEDAMKRAYPA